MDDLHLANKAKKNLHERGGRKAVVPKINMYDQGMSALLENLGMGMHDIEDLGLISYFLSVLYQPL